jgi:hypothetical protein
MKLSFIKTPLALLCAVTLQSTAAAKLPDAGCSLETLKGSYTWSESTRTDNASMMNPPAEPGTMGFTFAVSVGREVNDGKGKITSGTMTINSTYAASNGVFNYTGVVTVNPNCTGTYLITLEDGKPGGGGDIYIDPKTGNFSMLDKYNIGVAPFVKDGS